MTLYIDASEFGKVYFALMDGKKVINKKTFSIQPSETHKTLALLEKFLKQLKISNTKSNIRAISACKGPGSFTGIRVGVSLAQALGLAWGIPVKLVSKGVQ